MLHASLRRSGGSYIMTVPLSYVEQNHLVAGARLALEIVGDELKIKPQRPRRSLTDLLAATPDGLCRAQGWDELGSAGAEL
jgi:antitoxin component of MazEF toxin-antitoxin module